MTTDTTATTTRVPQEGPNYGGHAYYKYEDLIYTMNTVVDGSSSRYYSSSSNNRSQRITNSQVMDTTNNDSVASSITLESFQAVTYEMAKTQVYLRNIMGHFSFQSDGSPTGKNSENKSVASSNTTGTFP